MTQQESDIPNDAANGCHLGNNFISLLQLYV